LLLAGQPRFGVLLFDCNALRYSAAAQKALLRRWLQLNVWQGAPSLLSF
jgi:hypothetical protein